jgi:DNA-binding NarL/FixJ family response regulator
MTKRTSKILIVEDHPIVVDGYKTILRGATTSELIFYVALNCDEALTHLSKNRFDLVILDLQLPESSNSSYLDGEDLGLLIRREYAHSKILVITAISDPLRITSVTRHLNPEGFIIKSDIRSHDLIKAVNLLLLGKRFYSSSVTKQHSFRPFNNDLIDDLDRKILYHLSLGEKTKDLQRFVPLSRRGIEQRKVKLRYLFGIHKTSGTNLIKEAKKRNII